MTSYTDSGCGVLMDRVELSGGGRVDFMESTMLGVQDRRGHYVVLKCQSDEEAKSWERVLSANIVANDELSGMFVHPVSLPPPNQLSNIHSNVLVVDFGGSSVRAGVTR